MFERFTERARQVVVNGQEAARELKHECITSGHLLIGLIDEEQGLAARVLAQRGVKREDVVASVAAKHKAGSPDGQLPFTDEAKHGMEGALREALAFGHNYIGTEHLLLGLLRVPLGHQGQYEAATIMAELGLGEDLIRNSVIEQLSGPGGRKQSGKPRTEDGKFEGEQKEPFEGLVDDLRPMLASFLRFVAERIEPQKS